MKPDFTHCECGRMEPTKKRETHYGDFVEECLKCGKLFNGQYEVLNIYKNPEELFKQHE